MTVTQTHATPPVLTPRLRGILHLVCLPVVAIAGITLTATAPTLSGRIAVAIYAACSIALFAVSALYHRSPRQPEAKTVLKRLDHANIYLIIAGTYTPVATLALTGTTRTALLAVIWAGALAGVLFRALWLTAPRWLYTALYIVLGWAAIGVMPQLAAGAGWTAVGLIIAGGLLYTVGGVVYALKRPNPAPAWFGFHEVFHAFTIAAYICQFAAVALIVFTV